uniref:50S ribosomal protein L35 n=1 Tax=Ananas comosus var. bracteatus TaxID=296719 RepID=A0A6V7NJD0_ANACO|nr:unnamed protein product [Ananas comosus var. bracteatus]
MLLLSSLRFICPCSIPISSIRSLKKEHLERVNPFYLFALKAMQQWGSRLGRHFFLSSSRLAASADFPSRLRSVAFPANGSIFRSLFSSSGLSLPSPALRPHRLGLGFSTTSLHLPVTQVRNYAAKDRSRAPITPTISKVKKYKLKAPSSFKFRFRTMNDGQIRRWRAGKRHNAHLKTKKAKRRLRKPAVVHAAYAKVIKKLNFCGCLWFYLKKMSSLKDDEVSLENFIFLLINKMMQF